MMILQKVATAASGKKERKKGEKKEKVMIKMSTDDALAGDERKKITFWNKNTDGSKKVVGEDVRKWEAVIPGIIEKINKPGLKKMLNMFAIAHLGENRKELSVAQMRVEIGKKMRGEKGE